MKLPTAKAKALTIGSVLLLVACSGTAAQGYQSREPVPATAFRSFASPSPASPPPAPSPLRRTEPPEPSPSPSPPPSPSPSPKPSPRPTVKPTRAVSGQATWYCQAGVSRCTRGYPAGGLYAAAGSELQVGDWRGRTVTVTAGGRAVRVRLIDVCACKGRRIIDLYGAAFGRLADRGRGILEVKVTW